MTGPVVAYRLAATRRTQDAFTGKGARLFGGRWNREGTPLVYCAENRSQAILELLVHTDDRTSLLNRIVLRAAFDASLVEVAPAAAGRWVARNDVGATQDFGTTWSRESRSAVLRVPTAITPAEFNYLINPAHPDFQKITVSKPEAFRIDPRLFKSRLNSPLAIERRLAGPVPSRTRLA